MLLKLFTVYDSKAEAYLPPFYLSTRGQAIRAFSDSVNDPNHAFNRHPADYTLFMIGEFDDQNASFNLDHAKTSLGLALEFKVEAHIPPSTLPLEDQDPRADLVNRQLPANLKMGKPNA